MKTWFFALGVILIIITLITAVYQHELVHVRNNSTVGVNSYFTLATLDGLPAIGTVRDGNIQKEMSNYELSQSFNETISYNLTPLITCLIVISFFGFIYLGECINERNEKMC